MAKRAFDRKGLQLQLLLLRKTNIAPKMYLHDHSQRRAEAKLSKLEARARICLSPRQKA